MRASEQVTVTPVLLVNMIGALGFSIVLPFLVFLVEDFGGNSVIYGLIGATYPAFQFVGAPVLGRWSDRMGRRRVLLLSQLGTLMSWFVFIAALVLPVTEIARVSAPLVGDFSLTLPLLVLFVARAIDGLTGGNVSVANAYVADVSTEETRNRNFGRMGLSFNVGMVGGPAVASLLGLISASPALPVIAATMVSLVAMLVIIFYLPEPSMTGPGPRAAQPNALSVTGVEHRDCHYAARARSCKRAQPLSQRGVKYTLWVQFGILLAFNLYYAAFPVFAAENLSWSVRQTGLYFTLMALLLVAVEGPGLAWLSKRHGEPALIVAGLFLMGVHFLYLMVVQGNLVYSSVILFAAGNGIMWPSISSYLSSLSRPEYQGTVQGVAGSVSSLASIIGLVVGGVLFVVLGVSIFAVSAALMWAAAALSLRLANLTAATARQEPDPKSSESSRQAGPVSARQSTASTKSRSPRCDSGPR